MAVFLLEDALPVSNLSKHSLFVFSIKTGTRRLIHLDKLSSVVRVERRTTEDSSSRRIMHLVPVFTLENDQTHNECFPKFVQTDNAYSSIKTANTVILKEWIQLQKRNEEERYKTSPFLE